jgi:hypothetical protein
MKVAEDVSKVRDPLDLVSVLPIEICFGDDDIGFLTGLPLVHNVELLFEDGKPSIDERRGRQIDRRISNPPRFCLFRHLLSKYQGADFGSLVDTTQIFRARKPNDSGVRKMRPAKSNGRGGAAGRAYKREIGATGGVLAMRFAEPRERADLRSGELFHNDVLDTRRVVRGGRSCVDAWDIGWLGASARKSLWRL